MMLLFPGQAVHCHLFMRGFFALPSFPYPTVNMEIVFVSLCVYTHPCMHIFTCAFVQRSFNVCLLYYIECKLVRCLSLDAVGVGGSCGSSRENFFHPPSINTLPHPVAVSTVNHLSSQTCSLLLKTQPYFYYHYYSELPLPF